MRLLLLRFGAPFVAALLPYSIGAAAASAPVPTPAPAAIVQTYANIAHAAYEDSLAGVMALRAAVTAFLAHPDPQTLGAARAAWKAARIPYSQTEGFRFGNAIVDEWEPKVNSWPLDEGLIDYVAPPYGATSDENPLYTLNVIAHGRIRVGAKQIDASRIDKRLLRQLQGAEGVAANVATGYHAIEFLLWGQDLHGTGKGAGERPYTDYDAAHCTHGNCARRAAYLTAATDLLVDDLTEMTADWAPGGRARAAVFAKGDGGLAAILTGLGSLSYGELAGERMKLGLILHDPEEEQDCFSDNTHNSHYYDEVGMIALWRGHYVRADGRVVSGASLRDYALARNAVAAMRLDTAMAAALARVRAIKDTADSDRMAYDQMIGPNNPAGNKLVQDAIDALVAQTHAIEGVVAALHLNVRLQASDKFENAGAR
jgi:putative iron-regulated protein